MTPNFTHLFPYPGMSRNWTKFFIAFLLFASTTVVAQQPMDSLSFATDGEVNTAVISQNKLYIGGNFKYVGKKTGTVAFFPDGSSLPDYDMPVFGMINPIDNFETQNSVASVVQDGKGGWFVGGYFTKVNNRTHYYLVHLLPDKQVDESFVVPFTGDITYGRVNVLKVDGNYLYVGGMFDFSTGGNTYKSVFRLDMQTLKIDASWNPALENSKYVDHIAISQDKVFLSGDIGEADGVNRDALVVVKKTDASPVLFPTSNQYISAMDLIGDTLLLGNAPSYTIPAKMGFGFLADGNVSVDLYADDQFLSAPSGTFYASISDGNHGWYVAGIYNGSYGIFHLDENLQRIEEFSQTKLRTFNEATAMWLDGNDLYVSTGNGGYASVSSIQYLFKLDATTGAIDTGFKPNPNGKVLDLLIKGDTLFVAGAFSSIAGVDRTGLAALHTSTGAAFDWDPSFDDTEGFFWGLGGHHISCLKMVHDTLYASGIFLTESQDAAKNISSLVRFDMTTGKLDTTFNISTADQDIPDISSFAIQGRKLYLVGDFSITSGGSEVKNAGYVDLADNTLHSFGSDLVFTLTDDQLFKMFSFPRIVSSNGNLFVTGYDVKQVSTGITRKYFTGLQPDGFSFTDWDPAPGYSVYSMAFSDTKALLSGSFYFVNYYPNGLIGIDIRTNKYISFPDVYPVFSIIHSDKYIFAGGDFDNFGDSTVNGLARLNRKTLEVTHFDHQIKHGTGRASIGDLSLGALGLYVAGYDFGEDEGGGIHYSHIGTFNSVAGQDRQNVCLLDPESAALKSWNPPPYNARKCNVFAFGKDVVMAGSFNLMPAWSRSDLARIDLNTGLPDEWAPQVGENFSLVHTLLVSGDTVFVGGDAITKINDKDASNLCAIHANTGTIIEGFAPQDIDGIVLTLYKKGSFLYAAGNFQNVSSVPHNHIARFNTASGAADAWDPQLEGSWNLNVNAILATDSVVYLAGGGLGVSGISGTGVMVRLNANSGALEKIYPGTAYSSIGSLTKNERGDIAAGMISNLADNPDFYLFDQTRDTLRPVAGVPYFSDGISKIKTLGNFFLIAGNRLKEKGVITKKPGLFVYDPVNDTVTLSFSTPVISGDIETFAVDDKTLVFAGDFAGLNEDLYNADIAFMQTPGLQLEPGVTSWNPKVANNKDPFALSVYGSGFTNNSSLSLISGSEVRQPDSVKISNRKLLAYFNGVDFAPGDWDLKLDIAPGKEFQFTKAVSIKRSESPDVWISLSGPDVVKANKRTTFYLNFGNDGSQAAYGVFLYLGVNANQRVELPQEVKHLNLSIDVDWDTVPPSVSVDYFLGEPFPGKVYMLFIPYIPANFDYTLKLKMTTTTFSSEGYEIKYAIGEPLFDRFDELDRTTKAADGIIYSFFRCAYDVVGIVADLTPGVGCIKSIFDNTVVAGMDKYMKNESVEVYDVGNSIGMIALGCVPGGAEMGKAYKISKEIVEMGADASGAFSSCSEFADSVSRETDKIYSLFSSDPNAKYGPSGRATSQYVRTDQAYQYMITYENDSAATAPAERVVITDTLDKNVFDLTTFKPLGFGFGDTTYFYKSTDGDTVDIDLRPEKNIIVRVFYQLSPEDGILTWTFLTLDPNTYQPTDDVNAGFLPPNKTAPEGEGNVLYAIYPLTGLTDGTAINNSAHIVFDWNASIPTGRWHNVTDNTLPESAVNSLPAVSLDKNFTVTWGGRDAGGIYAYTIYVAENDSTYYPWLPETTDTSAVFNGEAGYTYKFYSVAIDSAGNKETAPITYDAITRVSGTGVDNFGESRKMEIRIYPNPAQNQTNIDYFLPEPGRLRIDLLNGCGRLVKTVYEGNKAVGNGAAKVDLSQLPAGYYFVRVQTKKGVQTRKLVVR